MSRNPSITYGPTRPLAPLGGAKCPSVPEVRQIAPGGALCPECGRAAVWAEGYQLIHIPVVDRVCALAVWLQHAAPAPSVPAELRTDSGLYLGCPNGHWWRCATSGEPG